MTGDWRRPLRLLLALVTVGAVALFARSVDWRVVGAAARAADPLLLLGALVLNQLSLLLKGVRWWTFLRAMGARSFRLAIGATFAGAALNNVLVAQGGEAARVLFVARGAGIASARVLAALAVERTLDAATYLVLLAAAAWFLPLPHNLERWRWAAVTALAALCGGFALLARSGDVPGTSGVGTTQRTVGPAASAGGPRLVDRAKRYVRQFGSAVFEVVRGGRLVVASLLSGAAWILQIATYDFVARAAHLPLPIAGSVAALMVIGVSFLLRATPGNIGIFQVAYVLAVRPFGMPDAPAIAVALLIQAVQAIPTLVAGAAAAPGLLRRGRAAGHAHARATGRR